MCGIVGSYAFASAAPPLAAARLRAVRDAMALRGPDAAGQWISPDQRVGLGHRRLAIIDLSAGSAQPMVSACGRYRMVYNGEIYNYRELRGELEQAGYRPRSASDSEILLELFARQGAAAFARLRGMFALAIWDEAERRLTLARDPLGIKPLYYTARNGVCWAASQVKALTAHSGLSFEAEPAGEAGFYLWGHLPEPFTLHAGLQALPAGSWLAVDERGPGEPRSFFSLSVCIAEAEESAARVRPGERRERLRAALADSVAAHLIADVPVAVFLSAGLDSNLIAALAAEAGESELRSFTLGFEEFAGSAADETVLAEETAARLGSHHETRRSGRADFAGERERFFAAMDQPSIDGANVYLVSKAAHEAGLKVALSGLGGDELFAGYPSFRQVPKLASGMAPFAAIPGLGPGFRRVSAPLLKQIASPKYAGLLEYGGSLGGAYLLRRGLFMPWELPGLMGREAAREGLARLNSESRLAETVAGLQSARGQVSALEMSWYMRNQLLRDADWAGMAHSLEIRVPLVDAQLLAEALPPLLAAPSESKAETLGKLGLDLPPALLARRKTGFAVPLRDWIGGTPEAGERGLRGWARQVAAREIAPRREAA
ncbi:MAG: asparagine synthase (glutamine-hydrolyzing) [Rhodovibrionaceae bacterium]